MNLRILPTIALLAAAAVPTANAVQCGDYITDYAELTTDLACDCVHDPALTVEGPDGMLDLKEFTVSCVDPNTGDLSEIGQVINVVGHGAQILDGEVAGGRIGIDLEGDGDHVLLFITVSDSADFGIVTRSGSNWNLIEYCEVSDVVNNGIHLESNGNLVIDTLVQYCQYGIFVVDGENNVIERTDIRNTGFGGSGIYIERGSMNEIYDSIIEYSSETDHLPDYGIVIDESSSNIIGNNLVFYTSHAGIIVKNAAFDNVIWGGFVISDGHYGIRFEEGSNGGLIEGIEVDGDANDTIGISVSYCDDVTIEMSIVRVLSEFGIAMKGSNCNVFDVLMS